jgi:hypothetical protein
LSKNSREMHQWISLSKNDLRNKEINIFLSLGLDTGTIRGNLLEVLSEDVSVFSAPVNNRVYKITRFQF